MPRSVFPRLSPASCPSGTATRHLQRALRRQRATTHLCFLTARLLRQACRITATCLLARSRTLFPAIGPCAAVMWSVASAGTVTAFPWKTRWKSSTTSASTASKTNGASACSTRSAAPSSFATRPSGSTSSSVWAGGSTLKTSTAPWILPTWRASGGCFPRSGKRA